jgi:hypothetical protein
VLKLSYFLALVLPKRFHVNPAPRIAQVLVDSVVTASRAATLSTQTVLFDRQFQSGKEISQRQKENKDESDIESKNKNLSLKLSTGSSISVTTKQLNVIGRPTTSNIALIFRLVAMACSISLGAFQQRSDMSQERLWPKGTLSSCTGDFRISDCP